jgi:hypothetical protein
VLGYLAFAAYAWWDFTRTNHDGLANLCLFMVTAPVALVDVILTGSGRSGLLPSGHGYLADHALYYGPAVAVTALLVWLVARGLVRAIRRRKPAGGDRP